MITVKIMLYDMRRFFEQCVELYLKLTNTKADAVSKLAPTPYQVTKPTMILRNLGEYYSLVLQRSS